MQSLEEQEEEDEDEDAGQQEEDEKKGEKTEGKEEGEGEKKEEKEEGEGEKKEEKEERGGSMHEAAALSNDAESQDASAYEARGPCACARAHVRVRVPGLPAALDLLPGRHDVWQA